MNIDIPLRTKIERGCIIFHGHGLVINADTFIGENCTLRHSTTIGNKLLKDGSYSKSPRIGKNCDIGAHVVIFGDVFIGDNVKVGAGTIVSKSVDKNCTVYGNPIKVVRND